MSNCIDCQAKLPPQAAHCPECGSSQDGPIAMTLGGMQTLEGRATVAGAVSASAALEPGSRFADRYTVGELLGAGGMGVVHRAIDDVGEREVALKLIRADRAESKREVDRLVEEGLTARDIRHPNVVAVYDVSAWEGVPYISMEVVQGKSLRAWMRGLIARGEDVSVEAAISIARAVALGLRAAHGKGVIHRDLKPENVILEDLSPGAAAQLKVLDFGIARIHGGAQVDSASGSGSGVGTPRYMAPEQVTNADLAGPSADVYSLSVMLYELLVGVLPQGHWQPPSAGRADVPRAIDELVREGLSNRPQARPQSMEAFLERLDAAASSNLLDAGKRAMADLEEVRERWRKGVLASWNPRWTKIAGVGLLLLVVAALADEMGVFDLEPSSLPAVNPSGDYAFDGTESSNRPFPNEGQHEALEELLLEEEGMALPEDLTSLSGTWEHGTGSSFQVTVSKLGRVRGEGSVEYDLGYGISDVPASIRGRIRDGVLSYDLRLNGQTFAKGQGEWIGDGLFGVRHVSVDGLPLEDDVISVNGGRDY